MARAKTTARRAELLLRNPSWRLRIGVPLILLLVFIAVSAVGYETIEPEYTWLDSLYMTVITISTVGYEVVGGGLSDAGKLWSIFVISGGVILGIALATQVGAFIIEGQIRSVIGRRQVERKIAMLQDHVVLCGFGRTGAMIAERLKKAGKTFVVVDIDPDRVELAERLHYLFVMGDAQEEETLQRVGLERAAVLITTLATDAANVFVTLSARHDNHKLLIVAKAEDTSSQAKLLRAGANRVICPEVIGATRMADVVLRPAVVDFVEVAQGGVDLELDQLILNTKSDLIGKTLEELQLPRRFGTHVVAIQRPDGTTNYHPTPQQALEAGDKLILVGRAGASEALQRM